MNQFIIEIQDVNPLNAFARLQHTPYALFFDSADRGHADSRYSYIACLPAEMIEVINGRTTITNRNQQTTLDGNPFELIRERLAIWNFSAQTNPDLPPFQGGLAGYFGYDVARAIETLPEKAKADRHVPDLALGIYDQVLAFDHEKSKAWLITHAETKEEAQIKRRIILSLLAAPLPARKATAMIPNWMADFTKDEYIARVNKVIEYIRAGDAFQVNLSQRFEAQLPTLFDAFTHYTIMRETNPAPFASYMNLGRVIISSASPERFLKVDETRGVQTRPIKGTRKRAAGKREDARLKAELEASAKDRAENIMIVDLLRNDLSKCCEPGSIEASEICKVESFASVHHLVSTVKGALREDCDPLDLIKACFPGGSITGAPKIRAMEIIEELEPTRRGPYCGSMAYIGFDGVMDSNIMIRTLVYNGEHVSLQVGGGITAESDAQAEYEETLDKAEALFHSFDAYSMRRIKSV